jgi:hypothetical protein
LYQQVILLPIKLCFGIIKYNKYELEAV